MSFLRELSTRRSALAAPVILTAIALTILLAGCPEETSTPPPAPTPRAYTCEFGTKVDGTTTAADTTGCQVCNDQYEFQDGATAGGPGINCVAITAYVCENGIAIGDAAPSPNLTGCQSCTGDYALSAAEGGAGVSCVTPYVCENGTRVFDAAPTAGSLGCQMCNDGYTFDSSTPAGGVGATCVSTSYTCENGNPISGTGTTANPTGCQSCNRDYTLSAAMGGEGVSCVSDTDNDNIADSADNCPNIPNTDQAITTGDTAGHACNDDIDDDDDGLIEIWTLEQLHNMRYNLAGTSYDDEEADTGTDADTGVTTGAPTAATTDCSTATGGVYLCGYELMNNLDFDLDGDGSTVNPDGTLDTDDTATPHFVVADGGWDPIGTPTSNNRFAAIFEGNGFTISNLAIHRIRFAVGFFGVIDTGAHVRNIGVVDGSISFNGQNTGISYAIGMLVGDHPRGTISASYATGSIAATGGTTHVVGGLVGSGAGGSIIASYFNGNIDVVNSSRNVNSIGGLVGSHEGNPGSIVTASYAIGNISGSRHNDSVGGLIGFVGDSASISANYANADVDDKGGAINSLGGLVGRQNGGAITASYAVGDATGSSGAGDTVGALVGAQANGTVTASYGFGEVTNEETAGISTKPVGITAATALTAANTPGCSNPTYTTETVCTATTLTVAAGSWDTTNSACSAPMTGATAGIDYTTYTTEAVCDAPSPAAKAAGTWDASSSACSAPMTGATAGVTYSAFTTQASCTSTSQKLVETWSTWSNAADNTLNAWVFGTGVAPKLRYADYDGAGSSTTDYCALFPSTVTCSATGDELPGQ